MPILDKENNNLLEDSYNKYYKVIEKFDDIYITKKSSITKIEIDTIEKKILLYLNLNEEYITNKFLRFKNLPIGYDIDDEEDNNDLDEYIIKNYIGNDVNVFCNESMFSTDINNLLKLKIIYYLDDESNIIGSTNISKEICLLNELKSFI